MDHSLLHTLNRFTFHHDFFEDPLLAFVQASEVLFVVGLVILALGPGSGSSPWRRRATVLAGASAALALLIGAIISHFVDRSRPFVSDPSGVHVFFKHAADAGFPSDHATAAFAIATAIFLHKRSLGIAVLVVAAVLALGRVALGVHYPSDVAAGAVLGAACALLLDNVGVFRRIVDFLTGLVDRILSPRRTAVSRT